jgi:hypothetical protein
MVSEYSFGIIFARTNLDTGEVQRIDWSGYGLLRELLDDMEAEADKLGWFADPPTAATEPATEPTGDS